MSNYNKEHQSVQNSTTKSNTLLVVVLGMIAATSLFGSIYMMFAMADQITLIFGLGIVFVVSVGCMCGIVLSTQNKAKLEKDEELSDIYKAQKASYLVLKENFEELSDRMYDIEDSSALPVDEIIAAQKAIAKVTMSRSKENTDALMNSNDLLMNQVFGFEEKLEKNNSSIISNNKQAIDQLSNDLKNQNSDISHKVDAIAGIERKLDSISNSMNSMQASIRSIERNQAALGGQPVMMAVQAMQPIQGQPIAGNYATAPMVQQPNSQIQSAPNPEPMPVEEPVSEPELNQNNFEDNDGIDSVYEDTLQPETESVTEEIQIEEPEATEESAPAEEPIPESTPVQETVEEKNPEPEVVEPLTAEPEPASAEPEVAEAPAATVEPAPAPSVEPVDDDPNRQLSPDEIAAMFAKSDGDSKPEPAAETEVAEAPAATVEPAPAPSVEPVDDDPNRQLSPDEIAAMFAQTDGDSKPEPAAEPEPAPAPAVEPVDDDPNRQLSPDEIAAMFAQSDGDSKPEPAAEPEPAPAPAVEPVDDDPNKMLSPEEIAAMFANL